MEDQKHWHLNYEISPWLPKTRNGTEKTTAPGIGKMVHTN